MVLKLRGKHTLADFLNDTFALVPRIWKRALPVSVAAYLPGVALMVAAIGSLTGMVNSAIADSEIFAHKPSMIFSSLAPFVWLCVLASLALYLGRSFQKAYVCAEAGAAIAGRKPRFLELLRSTGRGAFLRVAVQDFAIKSLSGILAFAIIGLLFFPVLIGKMAGLVDAGIEKSKVGLIVSLIAVYLASILLAAAASWWIAVKTAVSAPAATLEGVNSFAGIGRSLDLVRGRSWRVFGAMFIVSLVISFGLGIVTGPITFIVILPGYFSFLKESLSGNSPSPGTIIAFLSSISWAIGVSMLVSGVVQGALWPSFLTLLHADLRIRAGELEPSAEDEPAPPAIAEVPSEGSGDGALG